MPARYCPLLALLLLALGWPAARAQTAALRGFVTDRSSGQSLPGVNVVLERDGQVRGTATDGDGLFAFAQIPSGRYVLQASFIGYGLHSDTLDLAPGEIAQLNIALAPGEAELDEVVVQTERTSGAARVTAGLQTIRPADIALVPSPDITGDLVNYLQTLPGVVSSGDRGGQLFIRGGEPTQNLVLLDGMPVYQPFHVLGFYSAFPQDILQRADVYAGAYRAQFGGQLSSVLDVSSRAGNLRRFAGAASVAPFVSAVRLEGPMVQDHVSLLGSARVSTIDQGARFLTDAPLPFDFGDLFGKAHIRVSETSQLSATGLYTWDRGEVGDTTSVRPDEVEWTNAAAGLRYFFLPKTVPVAAEVLLSFSRLQTELGSPDAAAREARRASEVGRFNGEANFTYYLGRADVRAGAFVRTTTVESRLGGLFQNLEGERDHFTEAGLYLEPEVRLVGGLRFAPGVRLTSSPNQNQTFVEPRGRVVWSLGRHELSAAAGLYHQSLAGVTDRRDATSVFTVWTTSPAGGTPRAFHAVAGYRVMPTDQVELSVEGFYKKLEDLSVSEWTAFPRLTTNLISAEGKAKGVDVRAEVRGRRWYFSANYGLSSVEYAATEQNFALWYGDDRLEYRPAHDRRHQANVVVQFTAPWGLDLSARWQFGSGLPFSRPLGFDRFLVVDGAVDPLTTPGTPRVIYERPFNAELPTYHRLDVSAEKRFDIGRAAVTAQLGVINAYDRRNLFAYDIFTLRRVDQLPVIPTFGLKVEVN